MEARNAFEVMELVTELTKLLGAAVLGFLGKILYDRRFAKRPDLRFSFERPATFGSGEKATIYQNLEIANVGSDTASNVRVIFKRPIFDLIEHQIQFDGESRTEQDVDRAVFVIPNLPPRDRALMSFVFSGDKLLAESAEHALVSVRADNCLGRPRVASNQNLTEVITLGATAVSLVVLIGLFLFPRSEQRPTDTRSAQVSSVRVKRPETIRFIMQASDAVARGKEATIEMFIENLSGDPFTGSAEIRRPAWSRDLTGFWKDIAVAPGKRIVVRWNLPIPESMLPGRYELRGEVTGSVFNTRVEEYVTTALEVK